MVVGLARTWDTIGGGNLEAVAVERARAMLAGGVTSPESFTSSLSDKAPFQHGMQCCGGEVGVLLEPVDRPVRSLHARVQRERPPQHPARTRVRPGRVPRLRGRPAAGLPADRRRPGTRFAAAVRARLREGLDPAGIAARQEFATLHTWDARAARLLDVLADIR